MLLRDVRLESREILFGGHEKPHVLSDWVAGAVKLFHARNMNQLS